MNFRMIFSLLGKVMLIVAALMLVPILACLWYHESILPFVIPAALTAAAGYPLTRIRPSQRELFARDGFVAVSLAWIVMSLFGALPFVISGAIPSFIDAFFETVSGFTTTGSSVASDLDGMARGVMFWRLFTHWIGGMGVLMFMLAVLPMDSAHSMHIMRAEVPGPTVGKLVPRTRDTAKILYLIYAGFTVAEAILLLLGGMSFYDAILHAFATAGTGGFSTHGASIAYYDSVYIETVIAVFMYLFGVNFNLYYLILIGKARNAFKSEELHVYFAIIVLAVAGLTAGITNYYGSVLTALRHAFFTVGTIISSTGFGTQDFTLWAEPCKWIILLLMLVGACAGSTGGGMKVARVMTLLKGAAADIRTTAHPRRVERVRLDGATVEDDTLKAVGTYLTMYFLLLVIVSFLISFDGFDVATNFSVVISCLSNIGPGITTAVGPSGSFAIFSGFSKLLLSITMLLGRLEILPIIILFSPKTWRK